MLQLLGKLPIVNFRKPYHSPGKDLILVLEGHRTGYKIGPCFYGGGDALSQGENHPNDKLEYRLVAIVNDVMVMCESCLVFQKPSPL